MASTSTLAVKEGSKLVIKEVGKNIISSSAKETGKFLMKEGVTALGKEGVKFAAVNTAKLVVTSGISVAATTGAAGLKNELLHHKKNREDRKQFQREAEASRDPQVVQDIEGSEEFKADNYNSIDNNIHSRD